MVVGHEEEPVPPVEQLGYANRAVDLEAVVVPFERRFKWDATTHPWEDFAETWAHYLHIVDTLEMAGAFGLKVRPRRAGGRLAAVVDFDPYRALSMETLVDAWLPIEFATNSLNRSMGLTDLYPFVISPRVIEKLGFIHALTHRRRAVLRKVC